MQVSNRLNGIGEYYFSQKLKEIQELNQQGQAIINLGIGSPDLPPHPDVIKTLQEESLKTNVHNYQGYRGAPALRNAFSAWYLKHYHVHLDPETEILPLLGSKEGIMHICMTYLNAGDEVLIPDPGYPTYSSAVKLAGGTCVTYALTKENNWLIDFDALESRDLTRVKMMWANYPHMPTGKLPDMALFEQLISFGKKHGILICHDNPYSFILNEMPMSIMAVDGAREVALELNSLSKSHNMAGWRVGVLSGARDKINDVLRFRSNMDSGMFLPVQLAAAKALSLGKDWFDTLNAEYLKRKEAACVLLNGLQCTYASQQAGLFIWAKVPDTYHSGYELSDDILYKAKVFITPGGIFGQAGEKFIRLSLCSPVDTFKTAINRIQQYLPTV